MEEKDNAALVFSGATKDWLTLKDAIHMRADKTEVGPPERDKTDARRSE